MNILITGCARSGTSLLLYLMKGFPAVRVIEKPELCPRDIPVSGVSMQPIVIKKPQGLGKLLYLMKGFRAVRVIEKLELSRSDIPVSDVSTQPIVIKKPQGLGNPDVDFAPNGTTSYDETMFLRHWVDTWKVLICIRDPRDVLTSRHPIRPREYWVAPARWTEAIRRILPLRGHPNVLLVRYESLVGQTCEEMKRIAMFLQLAFDESWPEQFYKHVRSGTKMAEALGGIRPIDQESIGRWRRPEHRARIESIFGNGNVEIVSLMAELGYDTQDVTVSVERP